MPRRLRLAPALLAVLVTALAVAGPASAATGPTQSRIVNATHTGSVPWQVALVALSDEDTFSLPLAVFCGGTIRDATHIITAAHCVPDDNAANVAVVAGAVHRANDPNDLPEQIRTVAAITSHPLYGTTPGHDFAILTLSSPLTQSNEVTSLPLATAGGDAPGKQALISGWGTTSSGGDQPDNLLYATIDVFDPSACDGYGDEFVSALMLCAGRTTGTTTIDTCQGDSGGPLAAMNANGVSVDNLIGIVSFGRGCADPDFPGVYTRVSEADANARLSAADPPARLEPLAAPAVGGTPQAGQSLTCGTGSWTDPSPQFSVRWLSARINGSAVDDVKLEGTTPALAITDALVGRVVTCTVRATNAGGARTLQAKPVGPISARAATQNPDTPQNPGTTGAVGTTGTVGSTGAVGGVAGQATQGAALPAVLTPPTASFTRRHCAHLRCTLTLTAGDTNNPASSATVTVQRISGCRKGKKGATCRKARTVKATKIAPGVFEVVAKKLAAARYRFTVTATSASGAKSTAVSVVLSVHR